MPTKHLTRSQLLARAKAKNIKGRHRMAIPELRRALGMRQLTSRGMRQLSMARPFAQSESLNAHICDVVSKIENPESWKTNYDGTLRECKEFFRTDPSTSDGTRKQFTEFVDKTTKRYLETTTPWEANSQISNMCRTHAKNTRKAQCTK